MTTFLQLLRLIPIELCPADVASALFIVSPSIVIESASTPATAVAPPFIVVTADSTSRLSKPFLYPPKILTPEARVRLSSYAPSAIKTRPPVAAAASIAF
jgi:hypothetical protein